MATTVSTAMIDIPDQVLTPFIGKLKHGSAIAQLSPAEPMVFGDGVFHAFDTDEAEYVAEGAPKGPSDVTRTSSPIKRFKFQKTVRFNDEVEWADEDHQLQVIQQILALVPRPLSRALDFGLIHAVDPKSGQVESDMSSHVYLAQAAGTAPASGDIVADLDAAHRAILLNGYVPNGVAVSPALAADAVVDRNDDGVKMFPDFRPGTEVSTLDAFRASTSDTVSAYNDLLGIVGDWNAVRWGIQRQIGLKKIEYGDPDGLGDLQRQNQIAFRAEIVYGWGVADLDAFSLITGGGSGDGEGEGESE